MRDLIHLSFSALVVAAALTCTRTVPVTGHFPVVQSTVTTGPCHSAGDACDDTAIWIHPTDPSQSVIIGDDKKGGLVLWNLAGEEIQFIDGNKYMNNVDIRYNFPLTGTFASGQTHTHVALVGVANETDSALTLYKVNPHSMPAGRLEYANGTIAASTLPRAKKLVYGGCMYYSQEMGKYYFFANWKDGTVEQIELSGGSSVGGTVARTFDVGGQVEGCVADDVQQSFYIGEEDVGIWRYDAEPAAGATRVAVDRVGSATGLKADVEGLTLYYMSDGNGYLIASGQSAGADVRNVVYARAGNNAWLGTFRVGDVDETDGMDATNFPLGPTFAHGVLITHDASPAPSRHRLAPFERVAAALNLTMDPAWDPRCSPYGTCTASTVTPASTTAPPEGPR
ncbi:MAG: phytase [Acidobacteriota bacterium]